MKIGRTAVCFDFAANGDGIFRLYRALRHRPHIHDSKKESKIARLVHTAHAHHGAEEKENVLPVPKTTIFFIILLLRYDRIY